MSEWTVFPEGEGPEVQTEDLCSVYGCDRCPGHVKTGQGLPILCDCECHQIEGGSDV